MVHVTYMPTKESYCLLNGSNLNSVDTLMLSIDGRHLFGSKKELNGVLKSHGLKIVRNQVVCA